jgi:hypothetical protein
MGISPVRICQVHDAALARRGPRPCERGPAHAHTLTAYVGVLPHPGGNLSEHLHHGP